MARIAPSINCNAEELLHINNMISSGKSEQRMVLRCRIIRLCHEGLQSKQIAQELSVSEQTVLKWRGRFANQGLEGLLDAVRTGKPCTYTKSDRDNIFSLLEKPAPLGQSTWDGESIANALNLSKDYVWKVLRKEGVQLQRMRTWCVSTDPEFAAKAADIIGLYLAPPNNAIVLCVDEKPSIQAIERKQGYVQTSSKKIVRGCGSTYKRNGTLNLFAALNVATGAVIGKTTETKKREDFQSFMNDVLADVTEGQEVHVILDNYCTHKRNDVWLKKHPNVSFHFTPTSASWLNQVEIWFGIMSRKVLKNGSFSSKEDLRKVIEAFIAAYHEKAHPFVWKKREVKGSQLRNTIANLRN